MISLNSNMPAQSASQKLENSKSSLGQAIERLASGLRINSAKDDAAGLAIANRMESNLRAGNQAIRNVNDGISLVQTAEGGLNEINALIQRSYEMAVQAANGTLSDADRASINAEFHQLRQEIDRIAYSTEIFGRYPLGPSPLTQVPVNIGSTQPAYAKFPSSGMPSYFNSGIVSTAYVPSGTKDFVLDINSLGADDDIQLFTRAGVHLVGTPLLGTDRDVVWARNGVTDELSSKSRVLTESNGFLPTASYDGSLLLEGGTTFDINGSSSGSYNGMTFKYSGDGDRYEDGSAFNDGSNGTGGVLERLSVDEATEDLIIMVTGAGAFTATATWSQMPQVTAPLKPPYSYSTDIVVGAAFGQDIQKITIDPTPSDSVSLGLDQIEFDPLEKAREAMTKLRDVLGKVDTYRGQYGALNNRFESVVRNVGEQQLALSAAKSRIADADYALEVSNMTRASILQQAGMAVLAQANQMPQQVLKLVE